MVGIHEDRLEPPPKEGPIRLLQAVIPLSVEPLEMTHGHTQVGAWGVHQQVVVVVHEAVGVELHSKGVGDLASQRQKKLSVRISLENGATPGPAIHDMIPGTLVHDAEWSRQRGSLSHAHITHQDPATFFSM
jgi:hypothetical protein